MYIKALLKKQLLACYWALVKTECHYHTHFGTLQPDSPTLDRSTRWEASNQSHLSNMNGIFKNTTGLTQQHLSLTCKYGSRLFERKVIPWLLCPKWSHWLCGVLGSLKFYFMPGPGSLMFRLSWNPMVSVTCCSCPISAQVCITENQQDCLAQWPEPKALLTAVANTSSDTPCHISTYSWAIAKI